MFLFVLSNPSAVDPARHFFRFAIPFPSRRRAQSLQEAAEKNVSDPIVTGFCRPAIRRASRHGMAGMRLVGMALFNPAWSRPRQCRINHGTNGVRDSSPHKNRPFHMSNPNKDRKRVMQWFCDILRGQEIFYVERLSTMNSKNRTIFGSRRTTNKKRLFVFRHLSICGKAYWRYYDRKGPHWRLCPKVPVDQSGIGQTPAWREVELMDSGPACRPESDWVDNPISISLINFFSDSITRLWFVVNFVLFIEFHSIDSDGCYKRRWGSEMWPLLICPSGSSSEEDDYTRLYYISSDRRSDHQRKDGS